MGQQSMASTLSLQIIAEMRKHFKLRDLGPTTFMLGIAIKQDLVAGTVEPSQRQYVVDIVAATRRHPSLRLGASPRASLQLLRAARAHAAIAGRDHALPEDVSAMAPAVLSHRVLMNRAQRDETPGDVVRTIVDTVPVPSASR